MNHLPELSREAIRVELTELYSGHRGHHLVAFFGRGKADTVDGEPMGEFRIEPVQSELDLRAKMPSLEDDRARIAYLVPWEGQIPLDLAGRFANSGRVLKIGPERRLVALTGAREVDPEAARSPIARHLFRPSNPRSEYPVPVGRITEERLWTAWIHYDWGFPSADELSRDELLAWAALDAKGPLFVNAMAEPDSEGVRDALLQFLEARLGPAAPVIWQAWEQGKGRVALELGVLCETLATNQDGAVRVWLFQNLKSELGVNDPTAALLVARDLGQIAPLALRLLERKGDRAFGQAVVRAADSRVDFPEVRQALEPNPRLPSSWERRLERLGEALEKGAGELSFGSVELTYAALRELEQHMLFKEEAETRRVKRAEMAVRLLAWLVARPDRKLERSHNPHSEAEVIGRWYAEEGGFVDWARRWARGTTEGALGRGAQAVVGVADRERTELDARFSQGLLAWVEAGRPAYHVVPIDQVLERFAARFLDQEESRRLLVVLMDGMAWAQAAEILQSLGGRTIPWGPVLWHELSGNKVGEGRCPVVLTALPSVTEVSRAAFFAGKPVPDGAGWDSSKDEERFRDNKLLQRFCEQAAGPRLLLRAESHTGDGSASQEALSLVADQRRRIVGIVINAIDSSLNADVQQHHDWTVDTIRSLPDLLDAARQAGRTVLLASDHGHVPADRLRTLSSPAKAGARWRPSRSTDEALQTGELRFRGSGVYSPKGAEGVVLLTNDVLRYGPSTSAGEHGGATLAEVVAPCLLIRWDDPGIGAVVDTALKVRPAHVPDWWHGTVREPVEVRHTPPPPSKRRKSSDRQLAIPGIPGSAVPAGAPLPVPAAAAPVSSPLSSSAMLEARAPRKDQRAEVVKAVSFLLDRHGAAPDAVFAHHMGVLPYRVDGFISKLQEVLNVDGYEVLRFDPQNRQVFVDKAKLEQQFEVKL